MFPVLLRIGPFTLATYGVLVAAAYALGIAWLKSQRENMGLSEERFWALVYCLFFGAVAGGKLLFVALNWRQYVSGRMGLISDFRYGFVFFGGLLGAVAMGAVYVRRAGLDFLRLADYFAAALPLGHWLGRLGCLAAGCCYGRPSAAPWAVRFTDPECLVAQSLLGVPLHPTQLYEAAGDLAIAAVLCAALKRTRRDRLRTGTVFFGYCLLYSILRFAVELFRGDDRGGFLLGLSPSQWLASACVMAVGPLLARRGLSPVSK